MKERICKDRYKNLIGFLCKIGQDDKDNISEGEKVLRISKFEEALSLSAKAERFKAISTGLKELLKDETKVKIKEMYNKRNDFSEKIREFIYQKIDLRKLKTFSSLTAIHKEIIENSKIELLPPSRIMVKLGLKVIPLVNEGSIFEEIKPEQATFLLWPIKSRMEIINKATLFTNNEREIYHIELKTYEKIFEQCSLKHRQDMSKETWEIMEQALKRIEAIGETETDEVRTHLNNRKDTGDDPQSTSISMELDDPDFLAFLINECKDQNQDYVYKSNQDLEIQCGKRSFENRSESSSSAFEGEDVEGEIQKKVKRN